MEFSVQLETKAFEAAIIKAAKALGRDLPEVYQEEADLLMRDIIKKTFPKVKGDGLRRVAWDIGFTAVPLHQKFLNLIQSRFGNGPYAGRIHVKGVPQPLAYAKVITSIGELRSWHRSRKHPTTGRVRKNSSNRLYNPEKAIVSKGVFDAYVREAKTHVGAAKGGWATAQLAVSRGRALPTWITSHRKLGGVIKSFDSRLLGQQTFIASNGSPFAKRYVDASNIVRASLKNRTKQLPVKLEKQLKLRYTQAGFQTTGSDINTGTVVS